MRTMSARLACAWLAIAATTGSVAAQETLRLAVGQRGLWDTGISEVGLLNDVRFCKGPH